jgi:hypothetical protein
MDNWELVDDPLVGQYIAIFSPTVKSFLQMTPEGVMQLAADRELSSPALESWRAWERFQIVDAGEGEKAIYNPCHRRFMRIEGENVDGLGGVIDVPPAHFDLPARPLRLNGLDLPPAAIGPSERFKFVHVPSEEVLNPLLIY